MARLLRGDAPDFDVGALDYANAETRPLFFLFGGLAGLLAIAYNRTLLATIAAAERFSRLPVDGRAGLIGAAVGLLAWFAPDLVGGGDEITQHTLSGDGTVAVVLAAFLLRFGLGAVSCAAATPGGLFAPLLVLGAQSGLMFGVACRAVFPALNSARRVRRRRIGRIFTGVVRASLTGIALVTEMTDDVTMLLPILGACFVAMLVLTLLHDPPIYDSLREHTRRRERALRSETKGV